ncbi:hypothetical protein [Achromobacter xylosoxidans]|uniref:Uncharacterized protein n=1 Tax=Alcaligenes xylosoxydans xylosoxydans TaxID=85698 RepID=A0A0X8NXS5_ALCXX|nr:hypothetical protein [Achromobacter xylosoxidans]AMG36255.1 hypothetical protein AL504_09570 [Achromobacter xylosoxidans]
MPLHLVPDAPKPAETEKDRIRKRIKALPKPQDMIQCPRCGGREVIETRIGVFETARTWKGGTKALLCALCFMRGERVVLK